ncbi:MAG: 4Fe-4S dicluster domain-containing protein [Bacteroidota bacterium]
MSIQQDIRRAGVVGAGGGGFPAHVKAGAHVDCVIANGAECEPLIHKDYELMVNRPREIVDGLKLLMDATGAATGIIGVKRKNEKAIQALSDALDDSRISLHLLGDFYPSGDEYILVYDSTGRLIPPQGIPLDVGIVVNNVETLYNVTRAADGLPVTEKFITVAGAVKEPATCIVPIGTTYRDALEIAGGALPEKYAVFTGGIMMGSLESDLDAPVTKTCAGLIVLPEDHPLIQRMSQPESNMHRIGKSACDQCSYCTELCPRYILGYDVQPHKVMRSLGFTKTGEDFWNQFASLCCSCGLCTLYACPENLFPKEACDRSKESMKAAGQRWEGVNRVSPHPMQEGRRTPLKQLMRKLGIVDFDRPSRFRERPVLPKRVRIPLQQHIGEAATPVVGKGERVEEGALIADVPEGKLGSAVHSSVSGLVQEVGNMIVIERE